MVGVPGRSQGCITCLSRKKGCDKQRPACSQCVKGGLTCGGYDRSRVFVNKTQSTGTSTVTYGNTDASVAAQDVTLPFSLIQTAYTSRYIDLFWSAYLPQGKAFTADAAGLCSGGWVSVAQDLYPSEKVLQLAMQAVALRGLATRDVDRSLLEQGLEAYARCLREFNTALRNPQRLKNDGVLCASRLLALYEVCLMLIC